MHWFSSLMVFLGTWASGYFIITTNAWMQHPVGYRVLENGNIELNDYWAVLSTPGCARSTRTTWAVPWSAGRS